MRKHLMYWALAMLPALFFGCGGSGNGKPPNGKNPKPPKVKSGNGGGPDIVWSADKPKILVEAEAAVLMPPFATAKAAEAAGGSYLTLASKGCDGNVHRHLAKDENAPERLAGWAELEFEVKTDGDYLLWIRKWTCCSCGDSFSLSIDDGKAFTFGNQGTTHRHWSWLAHQGGDGKVRLSLKKGKHKLKIINRGESGFRIDQIIFWADPKRVPQGQEKP